MKGNAAVFLFRSVVGFYLLPHQFATGNRMGVSYLYTQSFSLHPDLSYEDIQGWKCRKTMTKTNKCTSFEHKVSSFNSVSIF